MIDPLSVTAASLAILDAESDIAKFVKKSATLKNAPNDPLALNNEVHNVTKVVQDVSDLFRRHAEAVQMLASPSTSKAWKTSKQTCSNWRRGSGMTLPFVTPRLAR